jgi:LAO/AO transport system kinase
VSTPGDHTLDAPALDVGELVARARAGDVRAVGRALTLVERGGPTADAVEARCHEHRHGAHVVGVTGAPGAGKSTLVGQLVAHCASAGARPAVLAVDPTSPLTGGAILGDRIRMDGVADVFIRSMATRGGTGGLATAVPGAIRVLDAAGFDPVVVETVGVGQVEVDVARTADTVVVLVTPGWGDAIQANKAGLLELADVFAVNKADRPGASDAIRDLELMLDLSGAGPWRAPVIPTTATTGDGVVALADAIAAHVAHLAATGGLADRRRRRDRHELVARASRLLHDDVVAAVAGPHADVLARLAAGDIAPGAAAAELVAALRRPASDGVRAPEADAHRDAADAPGPSPADPVRTP